MVVLLAVLGGGPQVTLTYATDDLAFASVREPGVIAAGFDASLTTPRLLVTTPICGNPRRIVLIDSRGRDRRFHTLPNRPSSECARDSIAVAPGGKVEGYPEQHIVASQGPLLYLITPDGKFRSDLADLSAATPACTAPSTDLAFDDVGDSTNTATFRTDLVAFCGNMVYRVHRDKDTADVTVVHVATLTEATCGDVNGVTTDDQNIPVQGGDIVPESYTPAPANAVAANATFGKIIAVAASGACKVLASRSGATGVYVIPATICTFGIAPKAGSLFFARNTANEIRAMPGDSAPGQPGDPRPDLVGNEGRVLVTNKTNKLGIMVVNPGPPPTATVQNFLAPGNEHTLNFALDDGELDWCPRRRVQILVKPNAYEQYKPDSNGNIPVIILGDADFDVTKIQQNSTLHFGDDGNEPSFSHCESIQDFNKDGFLDLKCHFKFNLTQLGPEDTQAWLTGEFNPRFEGSD